MTHTPGPWTISSTSAVVGPNQIDGPAGEVICGRIANPDDARLIIATPDLLAATRALMRLVILPHESKPDQRRDAYNLAYDAINKATGQ